MSGAPRGRRGARLEWFTSAGVRLCKIPSLVSYCTKVCQTGETVNHFMFNCLFMILKKTKTSTIHLLHRPLAVALCSLASAFSLVACSTEPQTEAESTSNPPTTSSPSTSTESTTSEAPSHSSANSKSVEPEKTSQKSTRRTSEPSPKLLSIGATCGHATSTEFPTLDGKPVVVRQGQVDCEKAMRIVNEYLATPTDAHHGNWNVRQYGDWHCSMPTAGEIMRKGWALGCSENSDSFSGVSASNIHLPVVRIAAH